jgi:hypothetical protein
MTNSDSVTNRAIIGNIQRRQQEEKKEKKEKGHPLIPLTFSNYSAGATDRFGVSQNAEELVVLLERIGIY